MRKRALIEAAVETKTEREVLDELIPQIRSFAEELNNPEHNLKTAKSRLNGFTLSCSRWTAVQEKGIEALPDDNGVKRVAEDLINDLSMIGIFVVANGELESWIDNGLKHKQKWIISALSLIQNGNAPLPLREFVKRVNNYITSTQGQ